MAYLARFDERPADRERRRLVNDRLVLGPVELLQSFREHEAIVYEATPFPIGQPFIEPCEVRHLADSGVTGLSTLYVPPKGSSPLDPDLMVRLEKAPASGGER